MILLYIILAVLLVSLISLIGLFVIGIKEKKLKEITHYLVSFAVGTMLGGAFIHILPEAVETSENVFLLVVFGILLFFVIEKYFHWRHCHEVNCEVHATAYLNIIGDGIHNFMDGVTIAASFLAGIPVGIAATIAIMIHEIPQELGDYAILIHSGMERKKALMYNFFSALAAVAGAVLTFLFASQIQNLDQILLPIVAGGFIYMAGTDLMPELHKEKKAGNSLLQFLLMILGLVVMWALKIYFEVH